MQFKKLLTVAAALFIIPFALSAGKQDNPTPQKVRVQILVIADSSNSLRADIEAPVGVSAREIMERLFKMSYADFSQRFVNGIAGFMIARGEKKFWRLEVDGKAAGTGIAEIKISQPMQIRWVITAYK
jgi:hypothetical protein